MLCPLPSFVPFTCLPDEHFFSLCFQQSDFFLLPKWLFIYIAVRGSFSSPSYLFELPSFLREPIYSSLSLHINQTLGLCKKDPFILCVCQCTWRKLCQIFSALAWTIPLLCLFFPDLLFLSFLILIFTAFIDSSPVPTTWLSHIYTKDNICQRTEWERAAVVGTRTESFRSSISVCYCWCDLDEDVTSK